MNNRHGQIVSHKSAHFRPARPLHRFLSLASSLPIRREGESGEGHGSSGCTPSWERHSEKADDKCIAHKI